MTSSARLMGDGPGFVPFTLSGFTTTTVAAGSHVVVARGACTSGNYNGSSRSTAFTGSVTVLPSGFTPADGPTPGATASALTCGVERAAGSEHHICR